MKIARTLILFLPAVLLACSRDAESPADAEFRGLVDRYIQAVLIQSPERATALGVHDHDALLDDHSAAARASALSIYHRYLDSLDAFPVVDLSPALRVDHTVLTHNIRKQIFDIEELREWEWNPLHYNVSGSLYDLVAREYAPVETRMQRLRDRLLAVPRALQQARENLHNPSLLHTTVAIRQNDYTITLIDDIIGQYGMSLDAPLRGELEQGRQAAVQALHEYGRWLQDSLLQRANRDFRLGPELFRKKLAYSLDTEMRAEDILAAAEQALEETEDAMFRTALPMYTAWNGGVQDTTDGLARRDVVRSVLDSIAMRHPDDETVLDVIREDLDDVTRFLDSAALVTLPAEAVEVIPMPEFQRGVAVAYCDVPGPFEKNGVTFYAVAPTPRRWSEARRTSFYREYNYAMLKNMTVHEGIPGHYLQQVHAGASEKGSAVRGLYRSAVFAEGWATYAEEFMADAGYGGPEVRMQQLKMRLRQLLNAILDYRIHANGCTEREGIALLTTRGFQEEGEAHVKWMRACVTSTQLSTYFFGNLEMHRLLARYSRRAGADFSARAFHDDVLRFGYLAPRYIAVLLGLPGDDPVAVLRENR